MPAPHAFTTRFAPSPTGFLHRGHALSAAVGWGAARSSGGRFLLRIEDIDAGRSRPAFAAAIRDDLNWIGFVPDAELVQSMRTDAHRAALAELEARGLVYPCFCTRADIARAAAAPHAGETQAYPGTCRGRRWSAEERGRPHALRLDLEATGLPMRQGWSDLARGARQGQADIAGDPVLARKDGGVAYHLACVLDDAATGVDLVTRGMDLEAATPIQRLLQQILALPEPFYLHHPLLRDSEGRRLSKRDGAARLRDAGAAGAVRAELIAAAAPLLRQAGFDKSADAFTADEKGPSTPRAGREA